MKKNLLAVLLPVVAGVALSGTGFGLWVFKDNIKSKTIGASMQLEPAFNFKENSMTAELTVANEKDTLIADKIVFDEDYKDLTNPWKVTVHVEIVLEELLGKLMTAGTGDPVTYAPTNVVEFTSTELQTKLATHTIKVTQTLTGISDYISVDKATQEETLNNFTPKISSPMTADKTEHTHTLSNDYEFVYKPTGYNSINSKDAYTTFRTKLASASLTYKVEFDPAA